MSTVAKTNAVPTGLAVPQKSTVLAGNQEINVVESIRHWATARPHAPAIIHDDVVLSYAELEERSRQIAIRLRTMGVTSQSVVGVYAERSIALVVSALGIMRAGAAYLPLDPSYPNERLNFQVADAQADIIVAVQGSSLGEVGGLPKHLLLTTSDGRLSDGWGGETVSVTDELGELAYVIYTSGSTGRPKGAEITHSNLANMVGWYLQTLEVTAADRMSHLAAVGFDATVWELWPSLVAGASICVADDAVLKEPRALQDWLQSNAITVSFVPTPMAEKLMLLPWLPGSSLRVMMTGGDTLHMYPPLALPFKVVNNYGPTECTILATSGLLSAGSAVAQLPPIGRPITNVQVYIVDEGMRQVTPGVEGEILIGGRGVGRGYRNRPELTAEKFIPNGFEPALGPRLYRTGDRGCYLPDGQIAFRGRIDDQIKIRGVRMEPAEIEAALNEHPSVRESVIMAHESKAGDKRLVGYISVGSGPAPDLHELKSFLSKRLPEPMIPAIFVVVNKLPLNPSGKIDRRALPAPEEGNMLLPAGLGADPRDELEKRLQKMWEELLEVQNIGVQQDFFELGGDSLLAMRLILNVERELAFKLPLSALLEVRTIEDLARTIRRHTAKSEWSSLVAVQPLGSRPPLFCVHSHTGDVMYCEYIARGAGSDQPIYGLQSRAVIGKSPHLRVEEMSEHYVREVRGIQPQGPYHFFGFCFGGMVAFDMARRLMECGEEVAFLGFYNSPAPGTLKGWPLGQFTYLKRRTRDEWRKLLAAERGEKVPHILRNIRNLRLMIQRTAAIETSEAFAKIRRDDGSLKSLNLEAINIAAAKRFHPNHIFPGRITLFQSAEVAGIYPIPPAEGWKNFAANGLEVIDVPVDKKGWRGTPFVETVGGRIANSPR